MPLALLRSPGVPWALLVVAVAVVGGSVSTLAAYAGAAPLLPGALVLAAFCVVTYHRAELGVAAGLLLIAAEAAPVQFPLSPTELAMGLVAGCWAVRALARPGSVALPRLRDAWVLALLVSTVAGLTFAEERGAIVRVAILWALFYLVYLQCQTFSDRQVRTVLIGLALGAGIIGAVGVLSYLQSGPPQLYGGGLNTGARAAGAFGDANYSASLITLALIPAVALVVLDPRRLWWLAPVAVAAAAGVVFSLSRGGFLAMAAGLAVLGLWGRFRVVGTAAILVVLAVGLFNAEPITRSAQFTTVRDRLGTLTGSGLGATSLRPRIWAAAVDAGVEAPVFGVGVQNFADAAAERGVIERGRALENVHNIPLNFLAENGFVGLVGFLGFAVQLLIRAAAASRRRDPLAQALGLGLLATFVGFLVQGTTVMSLRVNAIAAAFFVLAGLITALADRARQEGAPHRPSPHPDVPGAWRGRRTSALG